MLYFILYCILLLIIFMENVLFNYCAVPENIHNTPTEGIGISWGMEDFVRPKNLKKCMKLKWNFQRVLEKNPFRRGDMDIFWNYYYYYYYWYRWTSIKWLLITQPFLMKWPVIKVTNLLSAKYCNVLMRVFLMPLPLLNDHPKFITCLLTLFWKRWWHISIQTRRWQVIKNIQTHVYNDCLKITPC